MDKRDKPKTRNIPFIPSIPVNSLSFNLLKCDLSFRIEKATRFMNKPRRFSCSRKLYCTILSQVAVILLTVAFGYSVSICLRSVSASSLVSPA